MPLSACGILRYQPMGGDALWVTIGLASHWPCITDKVFI